MRFADIKIEEDEEIYKEDLSDFLGNDDTIEPLHIEEIYE